MLGYHSGIPPNLLHRLRGGEMLESLEFVTKTPKPYGLAYEDLSDEVLAKLEEGRRMEPPSDDVTCNDPRTLLLGSFASHREAPRRVL